MTLCDVQRQRDHFMGLHLQAGVMAKRANSEKTRLSNELALYQARLKQVECLYQEQKATCELLRATEETLEVDRTHRLKYKVGQLKAHVKIMKQSQMADEVQMQSLHEER